MTPSAKVAFQATQAADKASALDWLARLRRRGPRFLGLLWLILCLPEAWAGPPFLTDDPQPVGFQHWELYVASIDFKTAGGLVGDGPHVEINYGIVPDVQLHLIAPAAYNSPTVGTGHYGYGDTELQCYFAYQFTFENGLLRLGKHSPK